MKETGQMTKSLAKVDRFLEFHSLKNVTFQENIPILTVIFMKVNGKMICDMELALILTSNTYVISFMKSNLAKIGSHEFNFRNF